MTESDKKKKKAVTGKIQQKKSAARKKPASEQTLPEIGANDQPRHAAPSSLDSHHRAPGEIPPETTANKNTVNGPSSEHSSDLVHGTPAESNNTDPDLPDPVALARGDVPMTVVGHLNEFRSRILIVGAAIAVTTIAFFFTSDFLLHFIMKPFIEAGHKLNIFNLTGGFMVRMKLAAASAILLSLPLILYQIWSFIQPAVAIENKAFARRSLISAIFFFYIGIFFVFFFVVPLAVKIFIGFITDNIVCTIGADDYLFFVFVLCFVMGFLFEFPMIVMILTKIGILSPSFLIQKRKYSIVAIWILAAIITPQDVLSQTLVAIPLMGLYEVSILISKMVVIRKKKNELMRAAGGYRSA